jgi:hypothetical protein
MKYVFYIVFLFCYASVSGQQRRGISIRVVSYYNGAPLQLNDMYYHLAPTDSVLIETFKCYISAVTFKKANTTVFAEKNSYHLVNADAASSMSFFIPIPDHIGFDEVTFNLGIDSLTNVSGALGGDLDPSKGMYWTWQSGYINFKLEGKSNLCATRKNEFQLHLGGYSGQGNALQAVSLKVPETKDLTIAFPVDKFLKEVDLAKQNAVMIPGKQAVELSRIAARLFEVVTK